jgi:hypothetical protein
MQGLGGDITLCGQDYRIQKITTNFLVAINLAQPCSLIARIEAQTVHTVRVYLAQS